MRDVPKLAPMESVLRVDMSRQIKSGHGANVAVCLQGTFGGHLVTIGSTLSIQPIPTSIC